MRLAVPLLGGYVAGTGTERTIELELQVAVLEERMNTMQERYEASLARAEAAAERRAKEQTRWMAGLGLAVVSAVIGGFVVLGFMLQS